MQRASQAGYTHVMISDSKFSPFGGHERALLSKHQSGQAGRLEFQSRSRPRRLPIGYSNDLLYNDPT